MGWTTTSDYDRHCKGLFTIKEYLDREFASDNPEYPRYEVLDSSLHGTREYYAAVRRTDRDSGKSMVFAMIALVSYKPKDPDGHTLGWKTMSENMGPYCFKCPERILARLDPPESDDAAKWRAECRKHRSKTRDCRKSLQHGTVVRFKNPLTFAHGVERQEFTVEKQGRRVRFRGDDGVLCRIPKIADRDFDVIRSAA